MIKQIRQLMDEDNYPINLSLCMLDCALITTALKNLLPEDNSNDEST